MLQNSYSSLAAFMVFKTLISTFCLAVEAWLATI